jgi:putative membrane protein
MQPVLKTNNKLAKSVILSFSATIFLVIILIGKYKLLDVELPFDRHIFGAISAVTNSIVTICLILGLMYVKSNKIQQHKNAMLAAIGFSAIFIISYVCNHIFNLDTHFGGIGAVKYVYYVILLTHIPLAAIILPFILFTAYYSLSGQIPEHKKLARITWPLWLYVSVSGVLVYLFIYPYYV